MELYRAEFNSTYPTYLRMFHSFPDIWKNVDRLRAQLLDAAKREMLDSPASAELATQLDDLLERTRTQKYRDDLAELTLITHKLRLLKHRLLEAGQRLTNARQPDQRDPSPKCSTRSQPSLHSVKSSAKQTSRPPDNSTKVNGTTEHFSTKRPRDPYVSESKSTRTGHVGSTGTNFDYVAKKMSSRTAVV